MQFLITVALLGWGFVSLWFFSRMRAPEAVIMSVLVGTLVLPEHQAIDLPALPPVDKTSVIAMWCLVGSWWKMPQRLQAAKAFRGVDILFVVILIGGVLTAATNPDPLVTGPIVRRVGRGMETPPRDGDLGIAMYVDDIGDFHISTHLEWRRGPSGERQTGDMFQFDVMDAALRPSMFKLVTDGLVKATPSLLKTAP